VSGLCGRVVVQDLGLAYVDTGSAEITAVQREIEYREFPPALFNNGVWAGFYTLTAAGATIDEQRFRQCPRRANREMSSIEITGQKLTATDIPLHERQLSKPELCYLLRAYLKIP
jgi:hypothetical protein